jgi:hypothetical protein
VTLKKKKEKGLIYVIKISKIKTHLYFYGKKRVEKIENMIFSILKVKNG